MWSPMEMEAPHSKASHVTTWTEVGAWALWRQRKEDSVEQIPIEGGYPWGNA